MRISLAKARSYTVPPLHPPYGICYLLSSFCPHSSWTVWVWSFSLFSRNNLTFTSYGRWEGGLEKSAQWPCCSHHKSPDVQLPPFMIKARGVFISTIYTQYVRWQRKRIQGLFVVFFFFGNNFYLEYRIFVALRGDQILKWILFEMVFIKFFHPLVLLPVDTCHEQLRSFSSLKTTVKQGSSLGLSLSLCGGREVSWCPVMGKGVPFFYRDWWGCAVSL